jgi:exopolysaccharide production protein ExoY
MGLIVWVLLGTLGVIGAVCSKLIADEFRAWAPTFANKIIGAAVQRLPAEDRERFSEEWPGHLNEVPGDLAKIAVACGCLVAAWDIAERPFGLRKRVLDLTIASLTLLLVSPMLLIIMAVLATSSPGPIFVRHVRAGRGGKTFRAFKFRTMHTDADVRLRQYLASNHIAQREWDATGRLRFDPRVTPMGTILRYTSFDEVPMLFNVLAGHMSMVGPRPGTVNSQPTCKPGVTGLWMDGRRFEDWYQSSWSLLLDVKIILATFGAVIHEEQRDFEKNWKIGFMVVGGVAGAVVILIMMNAFSSG